MKLLSLRLRNFKGVRDLTVAPGGNDLLIFGDNAAGKTTVADAYYWLLFGKDSLNRGQFEIKTLDSKTGEAIHHLEHEVEGAFEVGAKSINLRRVYKEDWVKTRGSKDSSFSGHTTHYFVNDVPVQKKEYDAKVESICSEKLFRLLSDPQHFNINLTWQERRRALLEVCGDITDSDVIAANPSLSNLPAILDGRTTDDHQKVLKAGMAKINERIKEIPGRIDENLRAVADLAAGGEVKPTTEIETRLAQLRDKRSRITSGGEVSNLRARASEIDSQMSQVITRLRTESTKDYDAAMAVVRSKQTELNQHQSQLDRLKSEKVADESALAGLIEKRDALRSKYAEVQSREFEWKGDDTCGACGQALPAGEVEAAKVKAQSNHNTLKSDELERIAAEGKATGELIAKLTAQIENKTTEIDRLLLLVDGQSTVVDSLKADAETKVASPADPGQDLEYQKLKTEKDSVIAQISDLEAGNESALEAVAIEISEVEAELNEAKRHNLAIEESARVKTRVAELEAEETSLAGEYERMKSEVALIEDFIKAKVRMLTDRINSKFSIARFKLFDVQVNGGIAECCETVVDGVPFASLNHGMRMNVGLDIINTLADHFGFAPPIVLDNAESVTQILPTTGQQIRLIVSAADKTLRIETAETTQKELAI